MWITLQLYSPMLITNGLRDLRTRNWGYKPRTRWQNRQKLEIAVFCCIIAFLCQVFRHALETLKALKNKRDVKFLKTNWCHKMGYLFVLYIISRPLFSLTLDPLSWQKGRSGACPARDPRLRHVSGPRRGAHRGRKEITVIKKNVKKMELFYPFSYFCGSYWQATLFKKPFESFFTFQYKFLLPSSLEENSENNTRNP